jgi:hypothetical protein
MGERDKRVIWLLIVNLLEREEERGYLTESELKLYYQANAIV